MLSNYLKFAIRLSLKHKVYSIINILGLAIGIAACMFILLYVQDELSYDKFNKNYERIYRVNTQGVLSGEKFNAPYTPTPLAKYFQNDFPEVEKASRMVAGSHKLIRYKNKRFSEKRFFYADSSFFEIFNIPLVSGSPKTVLNQPNSVVVTLETAKRYFGSKDPIGEIIKLDNGLDYTVTGICENVPSNSHFHFDLIASLITYDEFRYGENWINLSVFTYIVLKEGVDKDQIEKKLPDFLIKYFDPQLEEHLGFSIKDFNAIGSSYEYFIQAIQDIHLRSNIDMELEPGGHISYIYIFSLIAICILLIASTNFMNISTARSAVRAKEIGMRKVIGAHRLSLIQQFLSESILFSVLALLIGLALVELLMQEFNLLTGKHLSITLFKNWYLLPSLLAFSIILGLMAGSYPAYYLSSFNPIDVLRRNKKIGTKKSKLRSILVLSQFTVSIILFIGTIIIYKQLNFIQNKELGFDKENVIVLRRAYAVSKKIEAFKSELIKNPAILSASIANDMPGENASDAFSFLLPGRPTSELRPINFLVCDQDYAKTLGIKLKEGRFFSDEYPTDSNAIVINEACVKALDLSDPIGKFLILPNLKDSVINIYCKIVGVMEDFNYKSLHDSIKPAVCFPFNKEHWHVQYLAIKIRKANTDKTIAFLEDKWNSFVDDEPFEFFIVEERLDSLYNNEKTTARLFIIFSILAIFIACLGLFALASFTAEQKAKQIGLQKILGASISGIIISLITEFIKWVIIANIIAWPIAYILAYFWLKNFAYQTAISIWIFILSAALALFITILTVGFQAFKAATSSPVDAIKYE
ncbi:MAG: ABC transporter permease [Bacteroidales bacterium]|nr:ABC transporter permease [Bacteroidales bacterium]